MFLRSEGAFRISVDRDDSTRAWHLELEGWGRTATRALIVPGGLGWYCFGRVLLYPAV